jgi:hypothetical protein
MKKAKIGNKAMFIFASGKQIFGEINYIPVATGDSWIITEIEHGKTLSTVYIQQFDMMFLR